MDLNRLKPQVGETVRMLGGAFEGYTGEVSEVDCANSRLVFIAVVRGNRTPIECDWADVVPVGGQSPGA